MLTIGYDGTAVIRQAAGIGRYARELLLAMARLEGDNRMKVLAASAGSELQPPHLGPRATWHLLPVTDRVTNVLWHRVRLPIPVEARVGRIDLFHSPDFSLAPSVAPSIVTIHELAFEFMPQVCFPTLAAYLHAVVPRSIRRARAVIAPSAHTKSAIVERYGTPQSKIHVISEGVVASFNPTPEHDDGARLTRLGLRQPFLLAVGTLEPRKNLARLLEAFARIAPRHPEMVLAIAGRPGWLYEGIFERHSSLGLNARVRFITNAEDDDLRALYRRSEAVVYASLYEGFGLPALEALASGSPLVASGNTSIPEVAADAALYFDPWDVDDMAATIDEVLQDGELRERLREAGPKRAQRFTWARAAELTVELYRDVAGG